MTEQTQVKDGGLAVGEDAQISGGTIAGRDLYAITEQATEVMRSVEAQLGANTADIHNLTRGLDRLTDKVDLLTEEVRQNGISHLRGELTEAIGRLEKVEEMLRAKRHLREDLKLVVWGIIAAALVLIFLQGCTPASPVTPLPGGCPGTLLKTIRLPWRDGIVGWAMRGNRIVVYAGSRADEGDTVTVLARLEIVPLEGRIIAWHKKLGWWAFRLDDNACWFATPTWTPTPTAVPTSTPTPTMAPTPTVVPSPTLEQWCRGQKTIQGALNVRPDATSVWALSSTSVIGTVTETYRILDLRCADDGSEWYLIENPRWSPGATVWRYGWVAVWLTQIVHGTVGVQCPDPAAICE